MKSIHDLEDSFSGKSWLSINRPYLLPEMYECKKTLSHMGYLPKQGVY